MKTLITIICLISLLFLMACGDDDSPAEETPVRLAFAPSAMQGEQPYKLTVTVTGEGMEAINAETTFTGKQARIEFPAIPSGPNRTFTVEVTDKNGIVLYTGETTQSLSPGTPVTISIPTSRILVPVTVEVTSAGIAAVQKAGPYTLTVAVTGEGMEKMTTETTFTGKQASINFDVPSGSERTFHARIESNGGSIMGEGFDTRSLNSTIPITVSILISVNELKDIPYIWDFSPDGRYFTAIVNGDVELWDMTTFQKAQVLLAPSQHTFEDISFSPDGQFLAGATNISLHVWDMRTFQEIKTLEYDYNKYGYDFESVSYSPDRRLLAIAGKKRPRVIMGKHESWIWFWDMEDRDIKIGASIPFSLDRHSVSFSSDGRYLASVSDESVNIWDMMTFTYNPYSGPLKEIQTLIGHSDITVMNYSPDGKYLVTGAKYDTVKVWDMTTFQEVQRLFSKIDSIYADSVSFSPDNRYLAVSGNTNSETKAIKVWDMTNFQEIYTDEYKSYDPVYVIFTPDGRFFVTQYGKYTISTKLIDTNLWQ